MELNPFLADHVIGGNAVLPTVCATGWMASACEELNPGYQFIGYQNYRLFKGLIFDNSLPESVMLELAPDDSVRVDKKVAETIGVDLIVKASIYSLNAKGLRINHYGAEVLLQSKLQANEGLQRYVHSDIRDKGADERGALLDQSVYENGTLFHGPSFQGIQRILNMSASKLTLACTAPEVEPQTQGQFNIGVTNPFVDDLLYQAMLVWVRLQTGFGSLPSGAQGAEQFSVLQPGEEFYLSLDVVEHTPVRLIADLTLHNQQGDVYARLLGAQVTISEQLNHLFQPKQAQVTVV